MMTTDPEFLAVKLPFEPGEYLCTWHVPGLSGEWLDLPGLLSLEPGHYARGQIHGPVPIEWKQESKGSKSAGFPQTHQFASLSGRLSSGAHAAVMNGEVSYWGEDQGQVVGALAVLSLHPFTEGEHRKYRSIEFQIEGLESVLGVAPIERTRMPRESGDNTWSAIVNSAASQSWEADGITMSYTFQGTFRSFDAYEFRMAFAPMVKVTAEEPMTVIEWWQRWLLPIRRLISVATASPRAVTCFLALDGADDESSTRDQVFGWQVTQKPINSQTSNIQQIHSSVMLATDGLSLLDLSMRWNELSTSQHPMIETYGALATSDEQHPRSRFTLLLQSLEGAQGFESRDASAARKSRYVAKRDAFIERIAAGLSVADGKFLDKYLLRNPPEGLEAALIAITKSLPVDIRPELERTQLIANYRAADKTRQHLRVEAILARVRNDLSHGARSYSAEELNEAAGILDRIVRAELLRLLGAPEPARVRALSKPDR